MVLERPDRDDGDDPTLVTRVAGGDTGALARLYDRYAGMLLALARRMLGDAREAEDLVHDLFLEVWRAAGDYDGARGTVRAWILMRLRSRALDRRKSPRLARRSPLDDAPVGDMAAPDDPSMAADRSRVRRALVGLPAEQRLVLELSYFEGLSSSEIAERETLPLGTVKSRLAAGMQKLRVSLEMKA
ncbi:MAG TPA: sigma-70 family RNA polymerase sigma factor [Haliangiales bacterium]|nr:sigma-70 family RNA polymerase sigma factor [Haliangiales bacterium]